LLTHCQTREDLKRAAEGLLAETFQSLRQRVFSFTEAELPEEFKANPLWHQLHAEESALVEPADWGRYCPRADHQHLLIGPVLEDGQLTGALAVTRETPFTEPERQRMNRLCLHYSTALARLPSAPPGLTRREHEIAAAVRKGLRNAEVARALSITEHTVKQNLKSIYRKLGLRSRTELAARG
jgi:DNA-binding CsgD family transcriptional regulator